MDDDSLAQFNGNTDSQNCIAYDSESPDELALVRAAQSYGFQLVVSNSERKLLKLGIVGLFWIFQIVNFTQKLLLKLHKYSSFHLSGRG